MHTKDNKFISTLLVSLLILATGLSISFYFSRPQTVALADNELLLQTAPEGPADPVVQQQDPGWKSIYNTQNDITVELTSAKIISTGLEVGVCYTAPDNAEWRPMPGHLFYGGYEIYPDEIEFLPDEKLADGKNTGTRCALIRYRIDDPNTLTTPVAFSILRFYAPGREMYTPCQELQQRINTNPKANAYGLKAQCTETNDGKISVMLSEHSKSTTKDKASKLLDEIAKGEIAGLWEFTITEIEK